MLKSNRYSVRMNVFPLLLYKQFSNTVTVTFVALHTKRQIYFQNAFVYHVYHRFLCSILNQATVA